MSRRPFPSARSGGVKRLFALGALVLVSPVALAAVVSATLLLLSFAALGVTYILSSRIGRRHG